MVVRSSHQLPFELTPMLRDSLAQACDAVEGMEPQPERNGFAAPMARVPWISIVAVILALGFLASSGWSLYMTAQAAEAEARASAEYERGQAAERLSLAEQAVMLMQEADRQRTEAERLAAEKEEFWNSHVAVINRLLDETWAEMDQQEFIREGSDFLVGLQRIVDAVGQHDESVLAAYGDARLDRYVMPTLARTYNVQERGGEDILARVRQLLAELEQRQGYGPIDTDDTAPRGDQ